MTKILVTSDLHLSDKIWKHRPIERDSYYSWEQIVQTAITERCSDIILAGDVLDKQTNTSNPLHSLITGLKQLTDRGIAVYYNQGQHEYQTQPWMRLHAAVEHFDGVSTYRIGGLRWAGIDYRPDDLDVFLKSDVATSASVLVCHQVWLEFMGEACKPQGSFADIPSNVKYLITGDYHENICKKFGNLVVLSPGSTHLRSIAEPENKYVFILQQDSSVDCKKEYFSITRRELYTRRKIEIDAVKNSNEAIVLDQVEASLVAAEEYADEVDLDPAVRMPLLRLSHLPSHTTIVSKVEQAVQGRAHLFYKQVNLDSDSETKSLTEHLDNEDIVTMAKCLNHYVSAKEKPVVRKLAERLLASAEPEQALMQWVHEQTTETE